VGAEIFVSALVADVAGAAPPCVDAIVDEATAGVLGMVSCTFAPMRIILRPFGVGPGGTAGAAGADGVGTADDEGCPAVDAGADVDCVVWVVESCGCAVGVGAVVIASAEAAAATLLTRGLSEPDGVLAGVGTADACGTGCPCLTCGVGVGPVWPAVAEAAAGVCAGLVAG